MATGQIHVLDRAQVAWPALYNPEQLVVIHSCTRDDDWVLWNRFQEEKLWPEIESPPPAPGELPRCTLLGVTRFLGMGRVHQALPSEVEHSLVMGLGAAHLELRPQDCAGYHKDMDAEAMGRVVREVRDLLYGQALYMRGPYVWIFEPVTPLLEPLPCEGKQGGVWKLSPPLVAEVRHQYARARKAVLGARVLLRNWQSERLYPKLQAAS